MIVFFARNSVFLPAKEDCNGFISSCCGSPHNMLYNLSNKELNQGNSFYCLIFTPPRTNYK